MSWEKSSWLNFRIFFSSPSHDDAHFGLDSSWFSFCISVAHTHTQSLQLFSLATTNLSAGSSGWNSHQLLRFTQKPKTTLKVLGCVSMIMRENPKGNLWKSNTICCWLSSSNLSALIIHFDLSCVTLANCVDVFFKIGETLKNLKMLERGCQSQRLPSSVFPVHYTALKPLNVLKASFAFWQTGQSWVADMKR